MLFFILIRGAICLVVCAFSLSLIDSDCLSHIFQRASWLLPQPRCRLSYAKLDNSIRTTKIFYHVAPTNFPPHPFSDNITPTFGHSIAIRGRPHRGLFCDYPNPKRGRSSTRRQGSARHEEGSHIASFRCVPPFIFSILSVPNRLFLWAKFGNFFVCSRQTIVCSDQTMVCCRQTMVCSRQTKRRSLVQPKKVSTARPLRKTKIKHSR